ncbi:MAG: helix-turn-helix domain-containing protein [Bacteroidota bacterium]
MKKSKQQQKEEDLKKLGNRIRELRIQKGYSNYEYFAFENEIGRSQYGKYEKGEDMRYTNLLRVMRALGVTPNEFFTDEFAKDFFPEEKKK